MSTLSEELLYLIIQSLNEEGLEKISHLLEQETEIFFDMEYFEKTVLQEKWDEAEAYLSGFTKVHDNRFSTKIYFDLRKQKFLEMLDNNEREKALNMLMTELKTFEADDKELYEEMSVLLTADNIRAWFNFHEEFFFLILLLCGPNSSRKKYPPQCVDSFHEIELGSVD